MPKLFPCLGLLLAGFHTDRLCSRAERSGSLAAIRPFSSGELLDVLSSSNFELLVKNPDGLEELAAEVGREQKIDQLPRPLSEKTLHAFREHLVFFGSGDEPMLGEDLKKPPEPFEDTRRPFKDWGTKFVVQSLLGPGSENNFEFVKLVVTTVQNALAAYRREANLREDQIVFLFKGGNVLRLILQTFMNWFQQSIAADPREDVSPARLSLKNFKETYHDFFLMSDADFGIFIDTSLQAERFTRVQQDACLLAYLAQLKIRQELQSNLGKYFPLLVDWEAKGDSELQKWLSAGMQPDVDKFTSDGSYKDFVGAQLQRAYRAKKHDMLVFKDAAIHDLENTHLMVFNTQHWHTQDRFGKLDLKPFSEMPISWNDALDFEQSGRLSTFTLVRTKFNLEVAYTINNRNGTVAAPGELIDISVPKKGDAPAGHLWSFLRDEVGSNKRWDSNRAITTYKITQLLQGQQSSLTFHSEALFELKEELTNMLFASTHNRPWDMKKYEKRLARVMFLSFVDLFQQYKETADRRSVVAIAQALVQGWKESTKLNSFTTPFLPCISLVFADNATWRGIQEVSEQEASFFFAQQACVGSSETPVGLFWYHAEEHNEYLAFMQSEQSSQTILYNVVAEHALAVLKALLVSSEDVTNAVSGQALVLLVDERRNSLENARNFVNTILMHLNVHYDMLELLSDYYAFSNEGNINIYDAITMY
mmetsp:Transcript_98909/g.190975  ORF Transcript_98909/g.190975 Transcript_98909/m.190975 type:complete len:706 (-) Transcript_98909:71-2188(-)|eukprot:CAMPEP_0172667066 /NCGR_PEP_ID=MMETSP1074-20121228/8189_1 /TAXON_ID=2916 /ORGANISM="Ceratium fusus, Strain PA161109" /LENGTH=705 /DNA_ID=CAMNT_0013483529 /DNA_START=14 /DNA_END=2131 /DNA_ORIENTATION=-